jgi:hypothetical protein
LIPVGSTVEQSTGGYGSQVSQSKQSIEHGKVLHVASECEAAELKGSRAEHRRIAVKRAGNVLASVGGAD